MENCLFIVCLNLNLDHQIYNRYNELKIKKNVCNITNLVVTTMIKQSFSSYISYIIDLTILIPLSYYKWW